MEMLPYIYNDGGRSKYYRAKHVGDCVCRSIAIASGKDYKEIYTAISKLTGKSARGGQNTRSAKFKRFMAGLGFTWTACAKPGVPGATHLAVGELPNGRLVCSAAGHYVAVINGVVNDTWDSRWNSFQEPRRIYGYWKYEQVN